MRCGPGKPALTDSSIFICSYPAGLTWPDAHRLAVRIERAIRAALPGTEVVIHIEPIEERASWEDSQLLARSSERDATARTENRAQLRHGSANTCYFHISSSANGWNGRSAFGFGRDVRIAAANARSSLVVILILVGIPSTT